MNIFKKAMSLALVIALLGSVISASVLICDAVTYVTDGDYDYAVVSDNEFAVFRYNGSDKNLTLPSDLNGKPVVGIYESCFFESDIETVTIPKGYTYIGSLAFYGCDNLSAITIPRSLNEIGNMAFTGCKNLKSLDLSKTSVTAIPYAMCKDNNSLNSIKLPSVIKTMDDIAFENTAITELSIPDSVTYIGIGCFRGCESLKRVHLPESLSMIESSLFDGCIALNNVNIPPEINEIGSFSFRNCSEITNVELPFTVTSIGQGAFYNASGISKLFIPDAVNLIGEEAFEPMASSVSLKITCYEGSAAATYCENNNVTNFEVVQKLLGDSNLDGVISILDVTCIQKYKIGMEGYLSSNREKDLADVNKDGAITVRDATLIQMYLAKIITEF